MTISISNIQYLICLELLLILTTQKRLMQITLSLFDYSNDLAKFEFGLVEVMFATQLEPVIISIIHANSDDTI